MSNPEGRRPITIKDPYALVQNQRVVQAHFRQSEDAGRDRYNFGQVEAFEPYDGAPMSRTFQATLLFDNATHSDILEQVIDPLFRASERSKVELLFAGGSLEPAHTSLYKAAAPAGMSEKETQEEIDKLLANSKLPMVRKALINRPFTLNRLVLTDKAVILRTDQDSLDALELSYKARETLDGVLRHADSKLTPDGLRSITHVSIARFKEPASPKAQIKFMNNASRTVAHLRRYPITMKIADVTFGTTLQNAQTRPGLVK